MESYEAVLVITLYASSHLDTTDGTVLHGTEGINMHEG
jgi:hypothetical protein